MTMTVKEMIRVLSEMCPDKVVMCDNVLMISITEHGQNIEVKEVDEVVEYSDKVLIK